jgi:hypothetical protein
LASYKPLFNSVIASRSVSSETLYSFAYSLKSGVLYISTKHHFHLIITLSDIIFQWLPLPIQNEPEMEGSFQYK